MKYAIVYSSRTGNTKMLADTLRDALPKKECVYFGGPDAAALSAEKIYVGFWTDKGTCDEQTADFLKKLTDQKVFLFGTAGFGISQEYFDKILARTEKNIRKEAAVTGRFMCQGKMPVSVRKRYEKIQASGIEIPNMQGMIENFDKALTHPDKEDLEAFKKAALQ